MTNFWSYYDGNEGQYLFNKNLNGIFFFLLLALKALLYLPHLISAFLVTSTILDGQNSGLTWITLILLFSYLMHLLFQLIKSIIHLLKQRKNLLWLPLFFGALGYSCTFPTWIIIETAGPYFQKAAGKESELLIAFAAFIFFTYFHIHILHRSLKRI